MSATYQQITLPEMDDILTRVLNMQQITLPDTHEYVYAKSMKLVYGPDDIEPEQRPFIPMSLRVYTSIARNLGVSRDNGADAIRVSLVYRIEDRISAVYLEDIPRINRTAGWDDRLIDRVTTAEFCEFKPLCPVCQSPMTAIYPKRGQRFDAFLSCILFRVGACNGTLKLNPSDRS